MKSNNYNEIQISWNFLLVPFLAALAAIFETLFFFFSACFWALRTSRGTSGSFGAGDSTNGAATRSVAKIQNKVLKIIFKIWRIFPKGFHYFWEYRYQIFYSLVSCPDSMMITIMKNILLHYPRRDKTYTQLIRGLRRGIRKNLIILCWWHHLNFTI